MTLTWLLLLLPVASLSGYWIGRAVNHANAGRDDQLSKQYFQGLNHLLNDQPDQAIALFERIADNDNDHFETQLALGNLFRRRGELDRAMKLHQDLSVRAMLSTEQRALALLELGEDFVRAGLLDRAESLFQELLQIDAQSAPALKQLIGIYEQEKEWQKAIDASLRYEALSGQPMGRLIAHFECELDAIYRKSHTCDGRSPHLQRALAQDPDSVRVQLALLGDAINCGDFTAAKTCVEKVFDGDAIFVPDLIPAIRDIFKQSPELGAALFERAIELDRGNAALLAWSELMRQHNPAGAIQLVTNTLHSKPTVRLAQQLLELSGDTLSPDLLPMLRDSLRPAGHATLTHRCGTCGFGARQQHWQCPSCKNWGSVKPLVQA